ncbi:putative siderophore biosynthesis protein [Golovinomyces cichoracearum]|uniref:Putative siderophore biosynthesis protein n=1 Tax=Golovinomyces cichoracearum TaxID=62708 RepID=A0A420II56_9PEZI|nr:putative siderophore biosynthesis protein [Golovinomyces cichoracearum]
MSEPITLSRTPASIYPTRNVLLPNGQRMIVVPVFGGFSFKTNDANSYNEGFPTGWTVILQTEEDDSDEEIAPNFGDQKQIKVPERRARRTHPFVQPTLHHDTLFISSISNAPTNEFQVPTSPTRQAAMLLWISLYWYFHQQEPVRYTSNYITKNTADAGKPHGEWRIKIKQEGILRGRHLIQKLERMGLVMSEDSSVGLNLIENNAEGWSNMFTSQRGFWQTPTKLFLLYFPNFNPNQHSPYSPHVSRPNSPVFGEHKTTSPKSLDSMDANMRYPSPVLLSHSNLGHSVTENRYPIYCPPAPLQYVMSSEVRHPLRPKPPAQGEIFYSRYIPSVGQYLTFRTASISEKPVLANGPTSHHKHTSHNYNQSLPSISLFPHLSPNQISHNSSSSVLSSPSHIPLFSIDDGMPSTPTELISSPKLNDCQLLHKWMNLPRVSKFWNCDGPISRQEEFLRKNLLAKHSFPVIGLWDGKPFGYFEIYWAKEDILGRYVDDGSIGAWDRGIHVLVGENEYRGKHRVSCWLTALAHWAFIEDCRTNCLVLEPRVDNERFISYLQETGFLKEREITFPHKQSALMRLKRDQFEAPVI